MKLSPSGIQNTLFDHVVPYSFMEECFQDRSPEILIKDIIRSTQSTGRLVARSAIRGMNDGTRQRKFPCSPLVVSRREITVSFADLECCNTGHYTLHHEI